MPPMPFEHLHLLKCAAIAVLCGALAVLPSISAQADQLPRVVAVPVVPAPPVGARLTACAAIGTDSLRLECYDALTNPPPLAVQAPSAAPVTDEIIQLSGSGATNTPPFTTYGPWEIQWDFAGKIIAITIKAENGSTVDNANQVGDGSGHSYLEKAGRYFLSIQSRGQWNIRVVPAS